MHLWRGKLIHTIFVLAQPSYLALRYHLNPQYFNLTSSIWFALTAITWTYIVTKVSIPFFTSPLRHLPCPPTERFLTGHFNFFGGKPPTDEIADLIKQTPNDGLVALWGPLYLITEVHPTRPDTLMDMLNKHSYDWEKPVMIKKFLVRFIGEGIINAEADKHKYMRRLFAPAFSGRHIHDLIPLFYAKGLSLTRSMAREARQSTDSIVEMTSLLSRVTLDIIGAAGVGKDFNTVEDAADSLANLYAIITDKDEGGLIWYFLIHSYIPPWIVRHLKGTEYAKVANAQRQLRKEIRALLQEKRRVTIAEPGQQKDIISVLMQSNVDFSDDFLVDQLLTFLLAGHETTSSELSWATWLLAIHPQIQDRLRTECELRLPRGDSSLVDASTFDAESMPYLTAVCNEILRLYPTATAIGRHAVRTTRIGTQEIPPNTWATFSPWTINRSPDLWGPDADKFDPSRWLDAGKVNSTGGAKSPYAFITFLHGPRSCIGQSFARAEMKCLLAALVTRFRFEMANPNEKVEIGGILLIKPRDGLKLRVFDLEPEAEAGTVSDP